MTAAALRLILPALFFPAPHPVSLPRSQSRLPGRFFLYRMNLTSCPVKLQLAILAKHHKPDPHISDSGMISFSFSVCFENPCLWRTKILKRQLLLWFFLVLVTKHEWWLNGLWSIFANLFYFVLYRKPKSLHLFCFTSSLIHHYS